MSEQKVTDADRLFANIFYNELIRVSNMPTGLYDLSNTMLSYVPTNVRDIIPDEETNIEDMDTDEEIDDAELNEVD